MDLSIRLRIAHWSDGTRQLEIDDAMSGQRILTAELNDTAIVDMLAGNTRDNGVTAELTDRPERLGRRQVVKSWDWPVRTYPSPSADQVPVALIEKVTEWVDSLPAGPDGTTPWELRSVTRNNSGRWVAWAFCFTSDPEWRP